MTFSIGRQELGDPSVWPTSGRTISLSGDRSSASVAASVIERENVRWLAGTIQPVVWTEDTTKTGFYRVLSTSVLDNEVSLSTGHFEWTAELEPIPHHRAAEIEASCVGDDRTNAPNTPVPWYAIPNGYEAVNYGTGSISTVTRVGPGGTAFVMYGAGFYSRYARWTISASSFLSMAPKVQLGGVTVVGRQSTLSPFDVALDNGLVKLGMATGSDTFTFTFPASANANWGTPFGVDVGYWDGISTLTPLDPDDCYAARVTRDDAQVCAVRWSFYTSGLIFHVDTSLRRGSAICEIVISQESAYTNRQFGISADSTSTTDLANRVLRSAEIEGNLRMTFSDAAATIDGSVLYLTTGADQARFGVGVSLDNASVLDGNRRSDLREQFWAAQQITERFSGVRQ